MAELFVLGVIAVGLYKRGGRRFEWSRRSLRQAAKGLLARGEGLFTRGLRQIPAIAGQCILDMRSLIDDTLGLIDPRARKRIEERARGVMSRAEVRTSVGPAGGSRVAAVGRSLDRRYQALQQRYLEGSITLERYMEEAQRLQPPR